MKKFFLIAVSLGLLAGNGFAACQGPYCYDDQGAYISGGFFVGSKTLAEIKLIVPTAAGWLLRCSDCLSTPLVISTGTTAYGFAAVSVSTSATTGLGVPR